MFINNWYAACVGERLTHEPQRVRMLGCDFVLFRDGNGNARCLSDLCCHRGASLAQGSCRDGRITCPQHGWEFAADGRCLRIPAGIPEPGAPPRRARIPAYPAAEKYGLVFVFLGDQPEAERPTIPDILPEYHDTTGWHRGMISRTKDVNYLRMCENYNDPCHVHYVHEFGRWLPKGVTIETRELTDRRVTAFHASWDQHGKWSSDVGLLMEYEVVGCMSRNTNFQPGYPPQIVLATVTPVDAGSTQIFMQLMLPTDSASATQHQQLMEMTENQVMDEDYAVLRHTRPRQAAPMTEELLVETDLTVAQVRKMTLDYGKRHGMIDQAEMARLADTHIRVIPCPGHREDPKNWVHRTVPLLPAGD
jgi:phenylpropionate dioxygenase-like ring-hydroxylating dioxygenase large terminal subunit